MKWYYLSAERGNAEATSSIGYKYFNGKEGVLQDYVQAHMWFNLAVTQGDEDASRFRDFIAERMTPADISKAQRMAREWLEAHPQ